MKKLLSFILLFSAFTSSVVYASKEVGNGGNGLLLNGKPIVLDLIEAGVDDAPFFDNSVELNPLLLEEVKKGLSNFPETHKLIAQKLSEVEKKSPAIAWALAESFRLFNIRVVNEALVNIHDDDSVIDYDPAIMLQLAIRRGTSIFLNGTWWPKMQPEQKVALLIHEAVYAFQNTVKKRNGNINENVQLSIPARAITGYLFTSDLANLGGKGLERVLYNQSRLMNIFYMNAPIVSAELNAFSINIKSDRSSIFMQGKYAGQVFKLSSSDDLKLVCKNAFAINSWYSYLSAQKSFSISLNADVRLGLEVTNKEASIYVNHDSNSSSASEEFEKACVKSLEKFNQSANN